MNGNIDLTKILRDCPEGWEFYSSNVGNVRFVGLKLEDPDYPIIVRVEGRRIAHLDHTPENCSDDNLKALCQRCHNRYDAEHRKQTRKGNSAEKNKNKYQQSV